MRDQPPKQPSQKRRELAWLNLNAAGLDIGAEEIYACVPSDRDALPVRRFGPFTVDFHGLAAPIGHPLEACNIERVAMESTGIYWIPVYELLELGGFAVSLVSARHLKNVPGRKSDVADCEWLQH